MALFFAMGGTAYAAAKWTGAEIVDGSLTGADVAADSLTGEDIAPGSITGTELNIDALPPGGAAGASAAMAETSELIRWDQGFTDGYGNVVDQPPAGPVVGSIPEVGDLFISGCNPENQSATIGLRNTTTATLYGFRWYAVPYAPGPDTSESAPPDSEFVLYHGFGSNEHTYLIASGEGDAATITHLEVATWAAAGTCHYAAWWLQTAAS